MAARERVLSPECRTQHGTLHLSSGTGAGLGCREISPSDALPLVVTYPLQVRRWPKTWRDLRGFLARSR